MGDLILSTEARHLLAGKYSPIFKDNSVGEPEATYDVLPKKFDNMLPSDLRERHCLNPFGEVIGGYQQEPQLKLCQRKWTNYIKPPLHEGPSAPQGVEVSTQPV